MRTCGHQALLAGLSLSPPNIARDIFLRSGWSLHCTADSSSCCAPSIKAIRGNVRCAMPCRRHPTHNAQSWKRSRRRMSSADHSDRI